MVKVAAGLPWHPTTVDSPQDGRNPTRGGAARKQRRLATLTPDEDAAWVYALNYYIEDEGMGDSRADRAAWKDVQQQFPRLKEYDGAKP